MLGITELLARNPMETKVGKCESDYLNDSPVLSSTCAVAALLGKPG